MGDTLKDKTIKGLFWSGVDKVSFEAIHFIIGIVMARILLPSDYGIVGVLMVFISFSTIFIEGGLTTALIQKTDRTDTDFNTAFIYNIAVSLIMYVLLFFLSPIIADFYEQPQIVWLLRVLGIGLVISCVSSIQNTKLTISIDFKSISKSSFISGIISGVVGIICAYTGLGVWSLVIQQLLGNILRSLLLSFYSRWKPQLHFSKASFKYLFSFGSKLILANIMGQTYSNLYPLIIGKMFPMKTLGYYTRGNQYSSLVVNILKDMFMRVSFPILSSIKDDNERLCHSYRIYIAMSSFVIFPIMFILIIVAKPLVVLMLTEKWLPCVPFLMLLSVGLMFDHISAINLNLLYVKGRADLALKLEVIKKSVAFSILFCSCWFGIWGICIGQVLYGIIATMLNSKYTRTLIGLPYVTQLFDYGKVWIVSALSGIFPFIFIQMIENDILKICVGILLYISCYFLTNIIFKMESYKYFILVSREYTNKIRGRKP